MMDAVENSVLWEIPRDIMEELSDANGDIAYLYRSFFENSLMLSQLKADILRFESANDRYARLQQHFPEITKRAPLTMIASYLQMTLETLSRVRASIARDLLGRDLEVASCRVQTARSILPKRNRNL